MTRSVLANFLEFQTSEKDCWQRPSGPGAASGGKYKEPSECWGPLQYGFDDLRWFSRASLFRTQP